MCSLQPLTCLQVQVLPHTRSAEYMRERKKQIPISSVAQNVTVVGSASTTVNLPAQPITLTAMFNLAPIITTQPTSQPAKVSQQWELWSIQRDSLRAAAIDLSVVF
jgi:hypothetical protein